MSSTDDFYSHVGSGGGPAFPIQLTQTDGSSVVVKGLSVRDWFAGQVAGALAAQETPESVSFEDNIRQVAQVAYYLADAMLAAREK